MRPTKKNICPGALAIFMLGVDVNAGKSPLKSTGGSTLGTHSQAPWDGAPHFVLQTNMDHRQQPELARAVFGTGCFWGTEKIFWRLPGVHSTAVGYAQGNTPCPTYAEICEGDSMHAEVVQVLYDPSLVSHADLLAVFWACHDPTQGNAQGEDQGTQYRSGIYYCGEDQRAMAIASQHAYQAALSAAQHDRPITTEIEELREFHFAEDYHQQYLAKPGNRPYCSAEPTGVPLPPAEEWLPSELESNGHAAKLPADFWAAHGPAAGPRHCNLRAPNEPIVWRSKACSTSHHSSA